MIRVECYGTSSFVNVHMYAKMSDSLVQLFWNYKNAVKFQKFDFENECQGHQQLGLRSNFFCYMQTNTKNHVSTFSYFVSAATE